MATHHKIDYVEYPARDPEATRQFFADAFGWTFEAHGADDIAFADQGVDGGFFRSERMARTETGSALVVFYSERLEDTLEDVASAGGRILAPIFAFPGGRRFHFIEPSGNGFAVWSDGAV